MSDETVLTLPCFGIVVTLTPGPKRTVSPGTPPMLNGSIASNLHSNTHPDLCDDEAEEIAYNHAIDGIEALILGHACAGIDITTPAYLQGVESAVQGVVDNI